MALVHHRSVERDKRGDGRVRDFSDRRSARVSPHSVADKPIDDGARLCVVGECGVQHGVEPRFPRCAHQPAFDTLGERGVGLNRAHALP